MPLNSRLRFCLLMPLRAGLLAGVLLAGCSASHGRSTVAEGQYYAAGEPHYDQFFIGLYSLQVAMNQALQVPEAERRSLAQALRLGPQASAIEIGQRVRRAALDLSRAGIPLRFERHPSSSRPSSAQAEISSRADLEQNESAALVHQVQSSCTHLLRSVEDMASAQESLQQLERLTIALDRDVENSFSQAHFGKQAEVKQNLADAHQLITLMRARADEVRSASEQLLTALGQAIDTDDGQRALTAGPGEPPHATKKTAPPPARPGNRPAALATPARRPKPAAPSAGSAGKPAGGKATPAPRDFEP